MGLVGETKLKILREIRRDPTHGYDIAKNLDLSHGYIYTHLKELREEGMIEVVDDEGGTKTYRLTESGEHLLKAFEDRE